MKIGVPPNTKVLESWDMELSKERENKQIMDEKGQYYTYHKITNKAILIPECTKF